MLDINVWSDMSYKTTKKDFEVFQKECEKWIEYFGLKGWFIFFQHHELNENNMAELSFHTGTRNAGIHFNASREKKPSLSEIRETAFHEACELLLAPMSDLIFEKYLQEETQGVCHQVIAALRNTIFKESL